MTGSTVSMLARSIFERRRLIASAVVVAALLVPGASLGARLRSRLPDPWNGNRHVVVIVDEPAPPAGTPLVRIEPGLEILGVVEGREAGAAPVASDVRLRVSIFPEARGLPRDDSVIELRVSTPDLLEVVSKHFTPERRARLQARVAAWRAAHEQAIDRAIARLRVVADRELGADELGRRLAADPLLQDALERAFEREVVDPIEWRQVVGRALRSDAAGSTAELLEHAGPATATWAGLREVARERWERARGAARAEGDSLGDGGKRTLDAARSGDVDEALLEGAGTAGGLLGALGRADVWRLARDPAGWVVSNVLPDARDWEAWKKGALERTADNLGRALPSRKERLRRDFVALGKDLGREAKLEDRSLGFFRALSSDQALRDELTRRHGPEASERVARFAEAAATDVELQTYSREVLDSGLEVLAAVLREVALDEAGKGPNPLLVSIVRARLLGRAEPVLVLVRAGSGLAVLDGQAFVSRRR